MKRFLIASALALSFAHSASASNVGVSVSIGQPGFYGRLDIGGYPPPQLIYAQPVFIEPVPMNRPPIYLRVPPGHAKHWSKHCSRYHACGERVYFVSDDWYNRVYAPRYQEHYRGHSGYEHDEHHENRGHSHGHNKHDQDGDRHKKHGRGHGRDD